MPTNLPPGPTWAEALAVIRRHDPETAQRLAAERLRITRLSIHRTALARLESQALDLFEQLSQDGDRSSVAAGHDG
jgi:hypothetical protein